MIVEETHIERLRTAVTDLQATMFLTGSPPKDQDEALARLASVVDTISAEATRRSAQADEEIDGDNYLPEPEDSSPRAEVQDCKACAGTGFLEAVRFGPTGAFERDRPCDYCGATGKQPPAEPQGDKCIPSKEMLGEAIPKCISNEPQGDVVEVLAKAINPEPFAKDTGLEADREERVAAREKARSVLSDLTPLLALEVKERLEGVPRSFPCTDEHGPMMEQGESGEWLHVDAVLAALETPAPSEPEEG